MKVEIWPLNRIIAYARNPRKNRGAVDKVAASLKEFGWKQPIVVDGDGVIVVGHTRLLAAQKLGLADAPVVVASDLTPAQCKAYRLADNRTGEEAQWDEELLKLELDDLTLENFDLAITGFDQKELNELQALAEGLGDPDEVPALPAVPVSTLGDLWIMGKHRLLCGDATDAEAVARLLSDRAPLLMVTDPPYGIELDSEWRDRAGLNGAVPNLQPGKKARPGAGAAAQPSYMKKRIEGHTETTISGDTIADWSHAFELVPSLQVAYVWHASAYTTEVLAGLRRIGFINTQQIIWRKSVAALTRTHYWFQHEPCWYVRKKNAPWYGKPGQNTTVWDAASPKMIMGGSKEEKFDHPTQKPVELMQRSILNHLKRGELVYEPFSGSGTTLAAAQMTDRVCCGMELDPKYVDVIVKRWQGMTGKKALHEDGSAFDDRVSVEAAA